MPDAARIDSLPALEAAIWRELAAASGKGHPWRLAVLATVDGLTADARSVVLRHVDAAAHELIFYTDARSPKVMQIERQPEGTMVLWSQPLGWQLRLKVHLSVATSGLEVSSRWARLKMTPAAQDYLSPLPPGSTLTEAPQRTPTPERSTREHFAVVTARATAVDWLELHAEGHRRAAFDAQGARWLVP
jgi:pyridoxamine 5'-phosphate oxidase